MIRFCFDCNKEQVFDTTFDEDCLRCSECGSLPYSKREWEDKKKWMTIEQQFIQESNSEARATLQEYKQEWEKAQEIENGHK